MRSTPPTMRLPPKWTSAFIGSRYRGMAVKTTSERGEEPRHPLQQLERVERLGDVVVGHLAAGLDVGRLGLGRQENDRYRGRLRVRLQGRGHLQAVHLG